MVTIENRTGSAVRGIVISPVSYQTRGSDPMDEYDLGHRQNRRIELRDEAGCRFDVRIILDRQGEDLYVMDHNFCDKPRSHA